MGLIRLAAIPVSTSPTSSSPSVYARTARHRASASTATTSTSQTSRGGVGPAVRASSPRSDWLDVLSTGARGEVSHSVVVKNSTDVRGETRNATGVAAANAAIATAAG